jgi:HD-GYP domain-containing protein (c-di-GMP phosphodiesterase class II)
MSRSVYHLHDPSLRSLGQKLPAKFRPVEVSGEGEKRPRLEFPAVILTGSGAEDLEKATRLASRKESWCAVCVMNGRGMPPQKLPERVFAVLPAGAPASLLERTVERAFTTLETEKSQQAMREQLGRVAANLQTLNKIGVALSTERDTDVLLELILTKSREITRADAGSLYLVEEEEGGGRHLVFKLTQSDSHSVPFRQFTLPVDTTSIAGYSAATGRILNIKDAYRIRNLPFRLNRDFDRKFGYRTKSMLVIPMKNQKDEVIGVLQLINSKRNPATRLTTPAEVNREVVPFSENSQELASSLASQATVALENNLLYQDIQRLFEGFVKASVYAIESRDPSTFGHSERVATLTVALAEAVDRCESGPFGGVNFTRENLREIRYASLLHDFGKVGVREEVLVKAKKLYPAQMELVKKRFLYIQKALELEACRKKLDYVVANGNENYGEYFSRVDGDLKQQQDELAEFLESIERADEPAVLPERTSEKLAEIAGWTFHDPSGPVEPLLSPAEVKLLSIPKGSLDEQERLQIESHVIHSFRFLNQIPWTKELKRIPEIARAHHEKLNGSGYPYRMSAEEIPFQSKIMTISDIFDALTASDRPYKRAVPVERALDIIGQEVKSQLLDPDLYHLFVESKVFQLTAR